jgi:tetratricopeptide (TPR) repeat protein
MRAQAYFRKGEYDRAFADFDRAIMAGRHPCRYGLRGKAHFDRGEYDRAISDYDEAIRGDPRDPNIYFLRGQAYHAKGDYDRAIFDYDQALKLNPSNAEARQSRERAQTALATRQGSDSAAAPAADERK